MPGARHPQRPIRRLPAAPRARLATGTLALGGGACWQRTVRAGGASLRPAASRSHLAHAGASALCRTTGGTTGPTSGPTTELCDGLWRALDWEVLAELDDRLGLLG